MPGIIVPFVGETHRNAIAVVSPKFLDQPVVQLLRALSPPFLDRENSSRPPPNGPSEWQSHAYTEVAGDVLPAALSFSIWGSAVADPMSLFP